MGMKRYETIVETRDGNYRKIIYRLNLDNNHFKFEDTTRIFKPGMLIICKCHHDEYYEDGEGVACFLHRLYHEDDCYNSLWAELYCPFLDNRRRIDHYQIIRVNFLSDIIHGLIKYDPIFICEDYLSMARFDYVD